MIVLLIPIQILFFVVYPPPETTLGFFELFHKNWMVGLLSLDVLYYINNGLLVLVYLGLFAVLRKIDASNMLISLAIGFIGIAAYYASTIGFEMLSMSKLYFSTEAVELKQQLLTTGNGLIYKYKGTAFDVYYVFNAIALLLISKTMYKSRYFGRATATWGMIAGILMVIPSTAGTIGLTFSLIHWFPGLFFRY